MTDGKIMDEATASVDFATDEAIQAAIRSEFKSSTLLTIAHRLSSVIDYDRLLVLSDGKVAEFDTPIVRPSHSTRSKLMIIEPLTKGGITLLFTLSKEWEIS